LSPLTEYQKKKLERRVLERQARRYAKKKLEENLHIDSPEKLLHILKLAYKAGYRMAKADYGVE